MNIKSLMFCLTLSILLLTIACQSPEGNNTGSEYVPDMAHSIAYEANYYDYYSFNTWGSEEEYYKMAKPRKPVNGTIPRGYAGIRPGASPQKTAAVMAVMRGENAPNSIAVPMNGSVPYHFGDTDAERERAIAELINNPFPITTKGLAVGKELYVINCGICHGEKGDGNGYLVADENPNAKYPAAPRSFIDEEWTAKSNGAYYHSIMYGKGVMGSYADKLNYEERWQVIHYIRSLQAKNNKTTYSEEENTLNAIDIPGASIQGLSSVEHQDNHGTSGHEGESHDVQGGGEHSHDDGSHGH